MRRSVLYLYQLLTGIGDSSTGALLIVAPAFTLRLMGLHAGGDALPYLSFIGAFVLSVGLACLYGAWIVARRGSLRILETVWLLTAITRASVAIFVLAQIADHTLEFGWVSVAIADGLCVLIQSIGLRKGWLARVAR